MADRRTFLGQLLALTVLPISFGVETSEAKRLAGLYLAQFPAEADREKLAWLIRRGMPTPTPARLRARIRADYEAHRTVLLDGWLLSRTEARLLVLLSAEA